MRSSGIRLGEKFVFEDRGGVWEKVAEGRARCVFGSREDYNREIDIVQDCFVYVMFDKPKFDRNPRTASPVNVGGSGGIRVILRDDDDDSVVVEYENVSSAMVAAIAAADEMAARPPRKMKRRYVVMDTAVDIEDNAMCVIVRSAGTIGGESDERVEDKGLAGRGARKVPVERGRLGGGDRGDAPRLPGVWEGDGTEGKDMGGVRDGGDSATGSVPQVQDALRVEGEAVSEDRGHDGADAGRDMEEDENGKGIVEV